MVCPKCKNTLDESSAVVNGYICKVCGKLTRFTEQPLHCLERPKVRRSLKQAKVKEIEPEIKLVKKRKKK